MIIYNVTINVDPSIHTEWLSWMKTIQIPQVLATGNFKEAKFSKILIEEDLGGITYSVQYRAHSRESLENYYQNHADNLRLEGLNKFADKTLAFRTELEIIEEFTAIAK
ncbi:DUF4286 family protein [Bizionia argentinensis JUB59]|uniref:DUF4286 family protein n=1 Tax=Bizionia argentinensis JUB59 TaxID=1046627 RepID=G2ECY2_9FLAO|nr:DUF4286 family protein [Bizionia argentinensis]EGV43737.1 DUF4286 family protein [Bizionia argentinensis JUB59]